MDKKEMKSAYKNRKQTGGVVAVKNTKLNKWLIESVQDLKAAENKFAFFKENYSLKIKEDYLNQKGQEFEFEVLDTLDKSDDQEEKEFAKDLEELESLWLSKLEGQDLY